MSTQVKKKRGAMGVISVVTSVLSPFLLDVPNVFNFSLAFGNDSFNEAILES